MRHPTPVEIEEHLMKEGVSEVGAHLEGCAECAKVVRAIEALGDPMTWDIASLPDVEGMEDVMPSSEATEAVQARIREAERYRHADPSRAIRICDEALAQPACAGRSEEARHLSVLVLRERANAQRVLGALSDALLTIRRARELADGLLTSDYENAILDFIEGTVFLELEDLDPIKGLASRAEAILLRYGDRERVIKVHFLAAAVELRRGNLEGARALYLNALGSIGEPGNPPLEAGLLHNLANIEISLGLLEEAREHIVRSAELYRVSGMRLEVTRVLWLEARIAIATGDLEAAESRYLSTEREFLASGLELDAALVSLELIELYQTQERGSEIIEIATRLASVFAEVGTRVSLALTLAALRDAALRGDDVRVSVSQARSEIEELMASS